MCGCCCDFYLCCFMGGAYMKRKNGYLYEDLSTRKPLLNEMKMNDFSAFFPPTHTAMTLYESGHKYHCMPGHYTYQRIYDHYLLHYILDGKGTYYCPSGTYSITQGDLFLIRPNEPIHYQADLERPWTYYWIGFNGNEAFHVMETCGFTNECVVLHHGKDMELEAALHGIAYPKKTGISREYELLGYLYRVFACIIQQHLRPQIDNSRQYLLNAIDFINQQYSYCNLRVQDIADYVGIDRTWLYRIFDTCLHVSVQEYLQQFRLDKAKSLLRFSAIPVGTVAEKCGFENQAYFSTVFKKHYNMTPIQYRKQRKEAVIGLPSDISK